MCSSVSHRAGREWKMSTSTQRRKLRSAASDDDNLANKTLEELLWLWKEGSCSYYRSPSRNLTDNCLKPRSCYDCINTRLESVATGCMINELGKCVSTNYFDPQLDYRRFRVLDNNRSDFDSSPSQFPSNDTTYCEHDDPVCTSCRDNGFFADPYSFQTINKRSIFCMGADGCVCTSVCESAIYDQIVGGVKCLGDVTGETTTDEIQTDSEHKGKG